MRPNEFKTKKTGGPGLQTKVMPSLDQIRQERAIIKHELRGLFPFRDMRLISMCKKVNMKLIKRAVVDWLKILVFLLDDAVALLLIILLLRFLRIQIPLPITIVVAVLAGALIFMIHKVVIPDFRRRPVTGREGMIGTKGRVVKMLSPIGTIIVGSEYWRAKSVKGSIGVGEDVEIVGLDGLTLKVKHKKR